MLGELNVIVFPLFSIEPRKAHFLIFNSVLFCASSSPIGRIIMKPWFIKQPSIFPISRKESFGSVEVRFIHDFLNEILLGLRLFSD